MLGNVLCCVTEQCWVMLCRPRELPKDGRVHPALPLYSSYQTLATSNLNNSNYNNTDKTIFIFLQLYMQHMYHLWFYFTPSVTLCQHMNFKDHWITVYQLNYLDLQFVSKDKYMLSLLLPVWLSVYANELTIKLVMIIFVFKRCAFHNSTPNAVIFFLRTEMSL